MPRTGRPKTELVLSDEERETLLRWSRRAKSSQALALRSRIVLACADGVDNKSVAGRVCPLNGDWSGRLLLEPGAVFGEEFAVVDVSTFDAGDLQQ